MKAVIIILAVMGMLVLLFASAPTAFAKNGWGLEDPQLCVNGHLLTIIPATPADVYVTAPKGAQVDYDVENCGGDPSVGVVPSDNVSFQGSSKLNVTAFAPDGTEVTFSWNGQVSTDVADDGSATAKFSTK